MKKATNHKASRRLAPWKIVYLVLTLTGLLSAVAATACALQRCGLFPRSFIGKRKFRHRFAHMKRLWISTPQGKVEAWFIPARRRNASGSTGPQPESDGIETPRPAVIFAHGNGELIDDSGSLVRGYTRMGVHVMLCEYRGYGRSAGFPSEKRLVADHVKCYDRLASMKEVDPKRIFFHGRSLGTGVVCGLSTKRKPAGLILQSPFSSAAAMMARYWIPRIFVLDPFDNLAVLRRFEGPVLLFHGTRDRVVPFSHSKKLHRANPQSTFKVYSCGHNNFPYGRRFWGDVRTFLKKNRIL